MTMLKFKEKLFLEMPYINMSNLLEVANIISQKIWHTEEQKKQILLEKTNWLWI